MTRTVEVPAKPAKVLAEEIVAKTHNVIARELHVSIGLGEILQDVFVLDNEQPITGFTISGDLYDDLLSEKPSWSDTSKPLGEFRDVDIWPALDILKENQ
jgi:hypothetical protein